MDCRPGQGSQAKGVVLDGSRSGFLAPGDACDGGVERLPARRLWGLEGGGRREFRPEHEPVASWVIKGKVSVGLPSGEKCLCRVTAYLDDWIESHAMEIKPRILLDYQACILLYVTPPIGHLPIQAVRPSTLTKLYRDLLMHGGRDGRPLAVPTVTHLHAVLRKAFRDAVVVGELIGSNPVERAKRPRIHATEPGTIWTVAHSGHSWPPRNSTGCSPSSTPPPTPKPAGASYSTCTGPTSTSTQRRSPLPDQWP